MSGDEGGIAAGGKDQDRLRATRTAPGRPGGHRSGTAAAQIRDSSTRRPHRADGQSTAYPPSRRLLTLAQAAVYLGLSPWTIRELVWKGQLPVVRLTRKLLFDLRDLDRLVEQAKDSS